MPRLERVIDGRDFVRTGDAGVVDRYVQPSEATINARDEFPDPCSITNVHSDAESCASLAIEPSGDCLRRVGSLAAIATLVPGYEATAP